MTWAALIKCVYEVDPLKCPKCGGEMRIISFIEEAAVIEKILRHCGLWRSRPFGLHRKRSCRSSLQNLRSIMGSSKKPAPDF